MERQDAKPAKNDYAVAVVVKRRPLPSGKTSRAAELELLAPEVSGVLEKGVGLSQSTIRVR
jgi:hypothetical protein